MYFHLYLVTFLSVCLKITYTNRFALASHFLWGLWSIIQAKLSKIEFGYMVNFKKKKHTHKQIITLTNIFLITLMIFLGLSLYSNFYLIINCRVTACQWWPIQHLKYKYSFIHSYKVSSTCPCYLTITHKRMSNELKQHHSHVHSKQKYVYRTNPLCSSLIWRHVKQKSHISSFLSLSFVFPQDYAQNRFDTYFKQKKLFS